MGNILLGFLKRAPGADDRGTILICRTMGIKVSATKITNPVGLEREHIMGTETDQSGPVSPGAA